MQRSDSITVTCGSGDSFEVCSHTGHRITPGSEMPPDYDSVLAVDLVEYREWCAENAINPSGAVDILCFRLLHSADEAHSQEWWEEAESDFRKDLLDDLKERGLCPAPVQQPASPQLIDWTPRPMDEAPRDGTPILAYCQHEASAYFDEAAGRLTSYGSHCEGLGHVADGWHVVEWWDGRQEYQGEHLPPIFLPGCWFLSGSEGEMPAHPVSWLPVPLHWTPPSLPHEVANAAEAL